MNNTAWQKCCHLWLFVYFNLSIYLSFDLYIFLYIFLYVFLNIFLYIYLSIFSLHIYLSWKIKVAYDIQDEIRYNSIFLSIYLSFYLLSIYLSCKNYRYQYEIEDDQHGCHLWVFACWLAIYLFIFLSIYLSIFLYICLSIFLYIYLSIFLSSLYLIILQDWGINIEIEDDKHGMAKMLSPVIICMQACHLSPVLAGKRSV